MSKYLRVRFINYNERAVQVVFVSEQGDYRVQEVLEPKGFYDVYTSPGQTWIFKEITTGLRLMANNKRCFRDIDVEDSCHGSKIGTVRPRYLVYVSKPFVPTLSTMCIKQICLHLRQCTDVKFLQIPLLLKREIIKTMHFLNTAHLTERDTEICENNLQIIV